MPLEKEAVPSDNNAFEQSKKELSLELHKFNKGIECYFESLLTKLLGHISRDDRAAAKELLTTYPCPTPETIQARDTLIKLYL